MKKLNPYQRFIAATQENPVEVIAEKTVQATEAIPRVKPKTEAKKAFEPLLENLVIETEDLEESAVKDEEVVEPTPKPLAETFNSKKK